MFDCKEVEVAIGMELGPLTAVIAYHPVTLNRDTTSEVNAVFDFLARVSTPIVFCFPNTDAGSRAIVARAREFCMTRRDAKLVVNLPHLMYWSLLKYAAIMVGNSSSGIMEAASLELPVVDIGFRQHGRERAKNVLHAAPEPNAIESAFRQGTSNEFRSSLVGLENPYGDGFAAERIANVLAQVPLDAKLLIKQAVALDRRWQVPETESAS